MATSDSFYTFCPLKCPSSYVQLLNFDGHVDFKCNEGLVSIGSKVIVTSLPDGFTENPI